MKSKVNITIQLDQQDVRSLCKLLSKLSTDDLYRLGLTSPQVHSVQRLHESVREFDKDPTCSVALKKEYQYYLEHKHKFLKSYEDKFLVISQNTLVSVHDSETAAYFSAISNRQGDGFPLGTFLIQKCSREEEVVILERVKP